MILKANRQVDFPTYLAEKVILEIQKKNDSYLAMS